MWRACTFRRELRTWPVRVQAKRFRRRFSTALLLFGTSTVFAELKHPLNTIWGVAVKPERPFLTLLRDRFFSFPIVLAIGFLLLVSLIMSIPLAAFGFYMIGCLQLPVLVWHTWDFVISLAVVTGLFAMIFKLLPNVRLRWRDGWLGAVTTSLLFTLGKFSGLGTSAPDKTSAERRSSKA